MVPPRADVEAIGEGLLCGRLAAQVPSYGRDGANTWPTIASILEDTSRFQESRNVHAEILVFRSANEAELAGCLVGVQGGPRVLLLQP